jgi:hypothetical protein
MQADGSFVAGLQAPARPRRMISKTQELSKPSGLFNGFFATTSCLLRLC